MFDVIPEELRSSLPAAKEQHGKSDMMSRWTESGDWWMTRGEYNLDPYQKFTSTKVGTEIEGGYRDGKPFKGINFASQEYLSLNTHPKLQQALFAAVEKYGLHSGGSAALMGNTALSMELERRLADFTGYKDAVVFPIGWAAGYGAVKTLVKPTDHVIIDILAHACLQEASKDATPHVHYHSHVSAKAVEQRLERIRREDQECGILVITETLFSMDSDIADIPALREACDKYGATLLVDAAHDLGALGATGRGKLEDFDMVGRPDILIGAFSKSFASTGGFVAFNEKGFRFGLRGQCGPSTFTNAMTQLQASIVLASLDIIQSEEGAERRARMMNNSLRMREGLKSADFDVLGRPSAIVPMLIGDVLLARLMTRYAVEMGAIVNLVEHPAVAKNACRWRLQVMADHTDEQIDRLVEIALASKKKAEEHIAFLEAQAA